MGRCDRGQRGPTGDRRRVALGVVQPASSGISGGGFALVWDANQRKVTALDFREVAPGALDPRSSVPAESLQWRPVGAE
jgi:gamma-glutamyltranspeptidase/glutathione hydrolase